MESKCENPLSTKVKSVLRDKSLKNIQTSLLFFLNGQRVRIEHPDPEMTLFDYIRSTGLTGTKSGCLEGGCGACCVDLAYWNSKKEEVLHMGVVSCLLPIAFVDHFAVTTVEGLGSIKNGLHPIQQTLASHHATQCGYCTPGIVMNIYSALLGSVDIEDSISANLCRCTGYRPIIESARCLSKDTISHTELTKETVRDRNIKVCGKTGKICAHSFPEELKSEFPPLLLSGSNSSFFRPASLSSLLSILSSPPTKMELIAGKTRCHINQNDEFEMSCGNTDLAYKYRYGSSLPRMIISLRAIPELHFYDINAESMNIGSSTTISEFKGICQTVFKQKDLGSTQFVKAFLSQIRFFANILVRNFGTVGGSLCAADALSDLYPVWLVSDSQVVIASSGKHIEQRIVPVREFLNSQDAHRRTILRNNEVVISIKTPWSEKNTFVEAFKVSKRREDCQGTVTCAFMIKVNNSDELKILDSYIAYGGVNTRTLCLNSQGRDFLKGKQWNFDLFSTLLPILLKDIQVSSRMGRVQLRESLIANLLFYIMSLVYFRKQVDSRLMSVTSPYARTVSTSMQSFDVSEHSLSAGRAVPHQSAEIHTTGEATYCADIPFPSNGLYAAYVLSKRTHALIKSIDPSEALKLEGVELFISAKDIPGRNILGCLVSDEPVFADKEVFFYSQPIGLILATSPGLAYEAASIVKVEYQELPFIQTIEEAIENNSFFEDWHRVIERGDMKEGFQNADVVVEGQMTTGPQEHFYIETQNCTVIPGGDHYLVQVASQNASKMQDALSTVLNMPLNNIVVKTMRLGGGFGGKQDRPQFLAAAAAVGAFISQRPVRLVLDRTVDISITGMRHGFLGKYKCGIKLDGTITALDIMCYNNAGWTLDLSSAVMDRGLWSGENCYFVPNLRLGGSCCRTNRISNTAFRGFGVPQFVAVCETAISHASHQINMPSEAVRQKNLYQTGNPVSTGFILPDCTSRKCWEQLFFSAEIEKRKLEIDLFNQNNKFKKRGLAVMPCRSSTFFEASFMDAASSLVQVYRDGSVHVTHSGIEMGQGIHTKMAQIAAETLGIPYELVKTGATETDKCVNTHPTAASSGTDLNGWAVYNACQQINVRLDPIKKEHPELGWKELVNYAFFHKINLAATGFFSAPDFVYDYKTKEGRTSFYYVWNALAVEVELDILTYDFICRRVDIVQDGGKSINPAIDIGQLEGAFLQGLGLFTLEEPIWANDGHLRTRNVSTYKIPTSDDVPSDFRVSLLKNSPNKHGGILLQKSLGESGVQSAFCLHLALRAAISDYRKRECKLSEFFYFSAPATSETMNKLLPIVFS